jgi:hypothetical protein
LKKFLFLVTAAILNEGQGCRTQFRKGPTLPGLEMPLSKFGINCVDQSAKMATITAVYFLEAIWEKKFHRNN